MSGKIIWRGKSPVDGAPLVAVAILASDNGKTGNMVQTYVLRADVTPVEAVRSGADVSICGGCVHRGDRDNGGGRTCYVVVGQGPLQVWKSLQAGKYEDVSGDLEAVANLGEGRAVRLGTYGDPAMVPAAVWQALISNAVLHTGYTHAWRESFAAPMRTLLMASADSIADAKAARLAGWRSFRTILPTHPARQPGEAQCPAAVEAGAKVKCGECGMCNGTAEKFKRDVAIVVHGGAAIMGNVARRYLNAPVNGAIV